MDCDVQSQWPGMFMILVDPDMPKSCSNVLYEAFRTVWSAWIGDDDFPKALMGRDWHYGFIPSHCLLSFTDSFTFLAFFPRSSSEPGRSPLRIRVGKWSIVAERFEDGLWREILSSDNSFSKSVRSFLLDVPFQPSLVMVCYEGEPL